MSRASRAPNAVDSAAERKGRRTRERSAGAAGLSANGHGLPSPSPPPLAPATPVALPRTDGRAAVDARRETPTRSSPPVSVAAGDGARADASNHSTSASARMAGSFVWAHGYVSHRGTVAERLRLVMGGLTAARLGSITDYHPESIRRYLHGASPPLWFVRVLSEQLRVDPHWLLTGEGSMWRHNGEQAALASVPTPTIAARIVALLPKE